MASSRPHVANADRFWAPRNVAASVLVFGYRFHSWKRDDKNQHLDVDRSADVAVYPSLVCNHHRNGRPSIRSTRKRWRIPPVPRDPPPRRNGLISGEDAVDNGRSLIDGSDDCGRDAHLDTYPQRQ